MASFDRERIKRFIKESLGDRVTDPVPARLGHPTPTTVVDAIRVPETVAGAPNYVYIRGLADADGDLQGVAMALNEGIGKLRREDMVYGAFIKVTRTKNGGWRVAGTDDESASLYSGTMNIHPQTSTVLAQFDNLLLQPTTPATMKAGIGYGTLRYLGKVYREISIMTKDFTADVPGTTGQSRAVCVEYSPEDNQIFYTNGATFASTLTDQEAYDGGYFPQPSNAIMCGWIRLSNGMIAIRHITNILAAHEVIAIDRIPRSLNHSIVIGTNQQYMLEGVTIATGGKIEFEGTGRIIFV